MTRLVLSLCGRPGCSDVGVGRAGGALVVIELSRLVLVCRVCLGVARAGRTLVLS